ncbi:SAM-dependent methyltransferase [Pseudomonas sp. CBSPBW29]|uniref:class I SAM-dependent methyltransferase n=1 Tax=Pseudomonas TaxID=286 RepID=UPI0021AC717D|nr:SAM-dependent methyltransferase [Pseudomonas sp. CBS]WEL45073.1 SAM-dependent methyltransferase [Pseudomonas sp. CBSPBW29]WEL66179.1 SAM-dependent methyltransferase [Pseudomonas sp. CBSPGW29]WEL69650.1 SAM-dependent methyltransferase [Pseudomonas sp. CBSPCGW29]WEL76625.1 SAM-dependent methyltransferase [Pseudomonas sp. CBSPAW29]WEL84775.1 SAM-dependent methyltransferase [Pseudomonas sp. CBSPCAW29]WEL87597.1 SAM-dependent methyltransferase [Pseudomonas sp. CBSPCBW29]
MSATAKPASSAPDHHAQFLELLSASLEQNAFIKLVLAKYVGTEPDLQKLIIKQLTVKDQPCLSFVYRYKTRDITKNFSLPDGVAAIAELLPASFKNAHLLSVTDEAQLEYSKKNKSSLFKSKPQQLREAPSAEHNREKNRFLDLTRPFLADLGVTNARHELIPAMSRKWKQINKFIEVFSHALTTSPLKLDQPVRVADFGSGKGYLTFAIHDYLRNTLNAEGEVTGVELREDMVTLCNNAAARLDHPGLVFKCGDVRSVAPSELDVMIALHACDIATDYAIHTGIRSGASIIMCSPCCHKQIRLQIQSPALLKPMLQYGLHLGLQAEMVTDSLRALFLEACGYETKVFEFISLEHTNKNKMILAVKRAEPVDNAQLLVKIQELKAFYTITEHCLETLLRSDGYLA